MLQRVIKLRYRFSHISTAYTAAVASVQLLRSLEICWTQLFLGKMLQIVRLPLVVVLVKILWLCSVLLRLCVCVFVSNSFLCVAQK